MKKHDYLEKLLNGAKVEWKPLGEICEIANSARRPIRSNLRVAGNTPYYGANNIQDYVEGYTHDGEYVLIAEDGSACIERYSIQWITGKFWANNHIHIVCGKNGLNSRFLFHYLSAFNFIPFLTGLPRAKLTRTNLEKIKIPIPPLSVQKEIVQILDLYTKIWYELTVRLSQYNYYRDKLLTFDDEVEWKKLGDIGEIIRGNGLQKKDFTETGFPAIHYGQIYTKFGLCADKTFSFVSEELAKKLKVAKTNDLLIATTSENDEDVIKPLAWLGEKSVISGDMMLFRHDENVKYLAYYFQTADFQFQKKKYITGTKVRRISKDNLAKIKIPIPSLEEQQRVVNILDKFDTLTNSITDGLPKEIELRQKQYEYYRNLLLDFPKI